MFRHLLKLTWKRKSRNLMLSLEIMLAFAVVFAIAAFALRSAQLYRYPIGFKYENVWSVRVLPGGPAPQTNPQLYEQFRHGLRELPEVAEVAFAAFPPFTMSTHTSDFKVPATGREGEMHRIEVSDDFFSVNGMELAAGRWFSSVDDGAAEHPVVINRALANALFGNASPIGQKFSDGNKGPEAEVMKVVGVVDEYRGKGELMTPVKFVFTRYEPHTSKLPRTMLLKLRPGTTRAFEARLNQRLKLIRNDWNYEISPLPVLRASMLKTQMVPLLVLAVIAAFMLAMVGFGLFGVLWQNTTRRIPEIGLRRAVGATAGDIYRQILAEQFLVSSGAIVAALVLLVQLPLTGALAESLDWKVFAGAAGLSMLVIYLISLLCALYPGWRASRTSPNEALHFE